MIAPALLHQAPGFIVVDKPAGMLVIPGRGAQTEPALREILQSHLGRPLWVVHRLDRETSGVLLFALDPVSHRTLSMAFESGAIAKRYLALVQGRVEGTLELTYPLIAARRGRMRTARHDEDGKPAHTRVRPLETFAAASLVEAEPLTGRQHQIRVHLTAAGHPLLVDRQYGRPAALTAAELGGEGEDVVLVRTPLHAARVAIPKLDAMAETVVESPLPEDMHRAADLLRAYQRSK